MAELKPLTKLQTLEVMKVETQNEITKDEIMIDIFRREEFAGNSAGGNMNARLTLETKVRALKRSLDTLEDMHKKELAEEEKKKDTKVAD